jgi:integrase
VAMLGLLGLRIFEATSAGIADLGEEHGHRVLRVCGKGTKVVLVPLPPAVGRAIDRAAGSRERGPILLNTRGGRMDRHAATRRLHRLAKAAGIQIARAHPHMLRHIVSALFPCRDGRDQPASGTATSAPQLPLPRCCLSQNPMRRESFPITSPTATHSPLNTASAGTRHTYVTTMLDAGADLRDVQIAARHADPRTTMRYDRARTNLDRHPNYILAAYMASGT